MKPTQGLKFLLPHLSDADHKLLERYVAEQRLDEVESFLGLDILGTLTRLQNTENYVNRRVSELKQEAEGL